MTTHEQEILRLKAKIMDALLLTVPECKGCDCANYVSSENGRLLHLLIGVLGRDGVKEALLAGPDVPEDAP